MNREERYAFINTTPSSETPTWKLFGDSVESLNKDFNTNEKTIHPITRKNAKTTTTGHSKSSSVTQLGDRTDPTFQLIDDFFWNEAKGSAAETDYLEVAPDRASLGEPYPAKKSRILISQQSEGGDGGDAYTYAYTIHWISDPIFGTVTVTEGVPSFTEDDPQG